MFKNRALVHGWMMQILPPYPWIHTFTHVCSENLEIQKKIGFKLFSLKKNSHHVWHRRSNEVFHLLFADFGRGHFDPTR